MCKSVLFKLLVTAVFVANYVVGKNILVVFPHKGKSHLMVFNGLFEQLTKRGHNLTVISTFPRKTPIPNWRDISVLDEVESENTELLNLTELTGTRLDRYGVQLLLPVFAKEACTVGLQHENFRKFLKEDNKFDVILLEVFNTNCFMGLSKIYDAPVIGMISAVPMPWTPHLFGSPTNPSYIPNHFSGFSDKMSFLERVENTMHYILNALSYRFLMVNTGNEFSKRYLGVDLFDDGDIMYNISLLLTNTHFSLNLPKPLAPSVIEVGGLQLVKPKKLPNNFEKYINDSTDGVIYMSMGSTIRCDSMPKERRDTFFKAFSKLKQRVILKWESEIENKPENVLTVRWAPQFDILCHPNVKAFISHGGVSGFMEAVRCKVPLIVMPQIGDQFNNAKAVEASGAGVSLNLWHATEESVLEAVRKALSPEMQQNMAALSERFTDRPLSPMDTAIYWIEYIARHKGARFMRTAAVDMPFYQYFLLDVIAFFILVSSLVPFLCYKVSCLTIRSLRMKKPVKAKPKTKSKRY